MAASTSPVLFSHSSVRALNDHSRNLADPGWELLRDWPAWSWMRSEGGRSRTIFIRSG
ncbi:MULTISPECIES: membrane dipeptidase [Streptomyces]|uniref:membrane dipeptidase n=1 Tax=Streptomyces TaxID=1883 RepID=UPI00292DF9A9|nr:membrane dipeptidase [Streptomyces sp. NEAU-HV9]